MPSEQPARDDLVVVRQLPKWRAVEVSGNVNPMRCVVTSIGGKLPADLKEGDIIPKGSLVRMSFNVARIDGVDTAEGLQSFAFTHYFRIRAGVVVIRGGAGTGKSTLQRRIVKKLVERNIPVLCMAPTGLVTQSMPKGLWRGKPYNAQTVAWFVRHPPVISAPVKQLHIIVDEYTMVSASSLERLWEIALGLCPAARITLIGDHAQMWPVQGLPPWSSQKLKDAQVSGTMAVYRLIAQKRFGECERMMTLIESLRCRRINAANDELYKLALKPPPKTGSCRLIAATHALTKPANDRMHEALATQPEAALTEFVCASGDADLAMRFCNGERVRICTNRYEAQAGGGVKYTQVNGQEGIVYDLPGGTVVVKKDTRIKIRLLCTSYRSEIQVAPKRCLQTFEDPSEARFDDDDDLFNEDGAAPKPKRRKRSNAWSFCGAVRPSSGQTAHSVQGSTFGPTERCVVDLAGFPQSIQGYHMLIVALSRVQRAENLYVLNYDPDMIARLSESCGCGCVTRGPHLRSHNDARLESYTEHLAALDKLTLAVYAK